jgi:hypothetical protein
VNVEKRCQRDTKALTAVADLVKAELMVEECLMVPGTLAVCIREVQKSLMQSSARTFADRTG